MAFTPIDPTKAEVRTQQVDGQLQFDFYIPRGAKGEAGGFVTPTLIPPDQDLNLFISPGDYRLQSTAATLALNYPRASMGGMMRVVATGGGSPIVSQIVQPLPAQNVRGLFQRSLVSGTWSGWHFLASQIVDQTAGRAIYTWDDVNNRSQLVFGDTGIRLLNLDNGFVGSLAIRRVNSIVTITGNIQRPPGGTLNGVFLNALPVGFAPDNTAWIYQPVRHNGSGAWFSFYRKNTELSFTDSAGEADGSQVRFHSSWSTVQPWPTSLPGTASGTIPDK